MPPALVLSDLITRGTEYSRALRNRDPAYTFAGRTVRFYLDPISPAGPDRRVVLSTPTDVLVSGDNKAAVLTKPGTWTASTGNLPVDGRYHVTIEVDDRVVGEFRLTVRTPPGGPLL